MRRTTFMSALAGFTFVALILWAAVAFAQDARPPAAPGSLWLDLIVPLILTLAGAIITAAISFASAMLYRWTGVQATAAARETLHSAAMTGVNIGLDKIASELSTRGVGPLMGSSAKARVLDEGVKWIMTGGAADSVKKLGASPKDVRAIVEGKLAAITNATSTVGVTTSSASSPGA